MGVCVLLGWVALKYHRHELINSNSLYESHTFYITGEPGSCTSMLKLSKQESCGKVISEDNQLINSRTVFRQTSGHSRIFIRPPGRSYKIRSLIQKPFPLLSSLPILFEYWASLWLTLGPCRLNLAIFLNGDSPNTSPMRLLQRLNKIIELFRQWIFMTKTHRTCSTMFRAVSLHGNSKFLLLPSHFRE